MSKSLLLLPIILLSLNLQSENQNDNSCGFNQEARKLAQLIINDPEQTRSKLTCSPLLSAIAAKKVKQMTKIKRVRHRMSNRLLIDAGYPLSKIYPRALENNVEALAGGVSSPEEMWIQFKESSGHRMHLLAEHDFYRLQDEIGVGFISDPKTPHVQYWAVYVAHRAEEKKYDGEIAKSKN